MDFNWVAKPGWSPRRLSESSRGYRLTWREFNFSLYDVTLLNGQSEPGTEPKLDFNWEPIKRCGLQPIPGQSLEFVHFTRSQSKDFIAATRPTLRWMNKQNLGGAHVKQESFDNFIARSWSERLTRKFTFRGLRLESFPWYPKHVSCFDSLPVNSYATLKAIDHALISHYARVAINPKDTQKILSRA